MTLSAERMNEVNWSVSIIEESLLGEESGPDCTDTGSAVEDTTSCEQSEITSTRRGASCSMCLHALDM